MFMPLFLEEFILVGNAAKQVTGDLVVLKQDI
jgi:hypothetical protein